METVHVRFLAPLDGGVNCVGAYGASCVSPPSQLSGIVIDSSGSSGSRDRSDISGSASANASDSDSGSGKAMPSRRQHGNLQEVFMRILSATGALSRGQWLGNCWKPAGCKLLPMARILRPRTESTSRVNQWQNQNQGKDSYHFDERPVFDRIFLLESLSQTSRFEPGEISIPSGSESPSVETTSKAAIVVGVSSLSPPPPPPPSLPFPLSAPASAPASPSPPPSAAQDVLTPPKQGQAGITAVTTRPLLMLGDSNTRFMFMDLVGALGMRGNKQAGTSDQKKWVNVLMGRLVC